MTLPSPITPGAARAARRLLLGGALLVLPAAAPVVHADKAQPPMVLATISIIADMARAVCGDTATVRSIVHVGGDPHVYEPLPSDARAVARAALIFRNGLGLERWLDRLLVHACTDCPVVTVTDGLQALAQQEGQYKGDPDPHLWMDPELAIRYVHNIQRALEQRFPEHVALYRANGNTYRAGLMQLSQFIENEISTIPVHNRKLVTTHDAFRYFGRRYNMEVVATIWGISTEREPSAAEVAGVIRTVKASGVPAVFVETTVNPKLMEQIARDGGVGIGEPLYGDSVGEPGSGADTYVGMMRANARSIAASLR